MLWLVLSFGPGGAALAQSPFSSGTEAGSILLDRGGFLQFQAADKAVQASYQYEHLSYVTSREEARPEARIRMVPRFGASLRAAADNNRGSIFADDQLAAGGSVSLNIGWSNLVSYRQSQNEQRRGTRLRMIVRDVVEEGGKRRPSLRELRDSLSRDSARLNRAISRDPEQEDSSLTTLLQRESRALSSEAEAAAALNSGFARAATEADRERLRSNYYAAVNGRRAATALIDGMVADRRAALDKRLGQFEQRRGDYVLLHPAIRREIQRRYPATGSGALDAAPHGTTDQSPPLTEDERFILRYILDGPPDPADAQATKSYQRELAMAKYRLAAKGPGDVYWDQLDFRVGASRKQYRLLDVSAPFANQVTTVEPTALSAFVSYSIEFAAAPGGGSWPRVLGVGIGAERRDNASTLKSMELRDVVFSSQSEPPGSGSRTVRTGESVRKVLRGTLDEYTAFVASSDFVLYPPLFKNRLGLNGFTRYASGGAGVKGGITPGIGAMIVQEGAPRKVMGGVSLYWERAREPKVDLVVGFNF